MARKGRTKVIYKGTFVCIQTLLGENEYLFLSLEQKKTKCCNLAGPAVSLTSPEGKNVKCTAIFLLHTYWPISGIHTM